ncbi:MAG: class I SAM-dependent methyltransferase [Chloroflexota bacterium]
MTTYEGRLELEARRWSTQDEARLQKRSWLEARAVIQYMDRRVAGEDGIDWLRWVEREFLSTTSGKLALSLGCNDGLFERDLVAKGICRELHGIDVSPQAIARAQEAAQGAGLAARFTVGDINTIELPPERCDMVFVVMAMHHFANLEHVLDQVNRCLKPDGFLVLNEYVGASRFQWPEKQMDLANQVLRLLPPQRRRLRDGMLRELLVAPSPADMERTDPFEAIRSAEIVPLVWRHLRVVAQRDYGGSILHPLLHDIVHNFEEEVGGDRELLRALCILEQLLQEMEGLSSDFTVIVARKQAPEAAELNQALARIAQLEAQLAARELELSQVSELLRAVERGRVLRALNTLQRLRGRSGF